MDLDQFKRDIHEVMMKYNESVVVCVFAVTYLDEEGNLSVVGNTLTQLRSRDHEEEALRNHTVKEVCDLATKLTRNTYEGR